MHVTFVYFMPDLWKWRLFVAIGLKQPGIYSLDLINYVFLASGFHLSFSTWLIVLLVED